MWKKGQKANKNMNNYVIDKAKPEDAEEILMLTKIVGAETDNLTFGAEGAPVSIEQEQEYLAKEYDSDCDIYLVARKDGRIVGTANYTTFPRKRMRHRGQFCLNVKKSEWGKGIGTRMVEEMLRFAKDTAGAEIVSLEVRADNERAIHVYEKLGFETIGCFKGFFKINGELVDCLIMQKFM